MEIENITNSKFAFPCINSLIEKVPSNKISDLTPYQKNIELKVMVIKKVEKFKTKTNNLITKALIADNSGSLFANFFDEIGESLVEGDILYINNAYMTLYRELPVLYQGKQCIVLKIGEFFFPFKITQQ